ncbi:glycosyl transferase [Amycolatopsis sp. MJM2582]|uniref:ArnT family glycosyltransferase n=1 Tax=Amycolatopsis sp. MJM2582 TaxID=1427749 RepID=UPI0005030410|nr:glycosyltransferase family 39 protein [Amycolatopsis sp. MJM2582]KFZ79983.1 glycosyl transferase [Amycolatopsis sp. MJM2582]
MSQDLGTPVTSVPPRAAAPTARTPKKKTKTGLSALAAKRIAVLSALVAGVAYGWGIGGNAAHYAYAAAVRSMAANWHNFLYGAYDPAGFMSVDKAPGALWLQALSVRVFGYETWALLLPGVIAGAVSVYVLFVLVRRWAGHAPAALAAVLLAATPITIAGTRVNLPDSTLILTLLVATYAFWRALEKASPRWLLLTAALVGLGFHIKLAMALAILPVLGIVYLVAAPASPGRRVVHLLGAGAVTAAVSSIWMLIVGLTPAGSRPYMDGSTSNSVWQMVWSYNLFDRTDAAKAGNSAELPVLPDGKVTPVDQGGDTGVFRLFNDLIGGQISWLLPLAVLLLVVGLVAAGRAPRTDKARAGWLLWGGWLVLFAGALSFSQSIHPYYTSILAPAIAAIAGAGLHLSWTDRRFTWALPVGLLATGAWAFVLMNRSSDYVPWLRPVIAIAAVAAAVLVLVRRTGKFAVVTGAVAGVALLAGPVAWAAPAFHPPTDPRTAMFQNFNPLAGPNPNALSTGIDLTKLMAGGPKPGASGGQAMPLPPPIMFQMMPSDADPKLLGFLKANKRGERFDVATVGGTGASPYIRAGLSVMPMGGFVGTMPMPTADGLADAVHSGQLRYVLFGGFAYDSPTALARKDWVVRNCVRIPPPAYTANPWMGFTSALFDCKPGA